MAEWLLGSALVATLAGGLVWFFCKTTNPRASVRHALWLVLLVQLLIPPFIHWPWAPPLDRLWAQSPLALPEAVPAHDGRSAAAGQPAGATGEVQGELPSAAEPGLGPSGELAGTNAAPAVPPGPAPERSSWPRLRSMLLALWASGALAALLRELRRAQALRRRCAAGRPADTELEADLQVSAARLRMPALPILVLGTGSAAPAGPFVAGLWRPTIYWPLGLLADSSPAERQSVLTHELAHVRRRDHLVTWLEVSGLALYWWLPTLAWIRRHLRQAAEEACDAWAIETSPLDPRSFAEALLAVCARGIKAEPEQAPTALAIGMSSSAHLEMEGRLRAILAEPRPARVGQPATGAACLLMALLIPGWAPGESGAPLPSSSPQDGVLPASLDDLLEPFVAQWPGSGLRIGVVSGAEITAVQEYGDAPREPHAMGSTTEVLTATLAASLRDQGLLDWDRPLEGYAAKTAITLRQLIEHTAGVPALPLDHAADPLEQLRRLDEWDAPGVEVARSPLNYALLVAAMESAAGEPYHDLLQRSVAEPLGLRALQLDEGPYAGANGASASLEDLCRILMLQLRHAAFQDRPLALSSVLELQTPNRSGGAWSLHRGLAWDQGSSDDIRRYRFRQSRVGRATIFLAFSPAHKVAVSLVGENLPELRIIGEEALALVIAQQSQTQASTKLFAARNMRASAPLLEQLQAEYPEDGRFPYSLGFAQLALRRLNDAAPNFLRAIELGYHESAACYNLACVYAVAGRHDEAFTWLERALDEGYRELALLHVDEDLASLRSDPRFDALKIQDY